jgi:hypothetical protein
LSAETGAVHVSQRFRAGRLKPQAGSLCHPADFENTPLVAKLLRLIPLCGTQPRSVGSLPNQFFLDVALTLAGEFDENTAWQRIN